MLYELFVLLVIALLAFLAYVAMQPAEGTVTRSAVIPAPPAAIFPHVNSLHKWQVWSPWAKIDPNAKVVFDGPETGPGAGMTWDGNNKVGQGKMTIIESQPSDRVKIRLDFKKPFENTSVADFTFKPEGPGTRVTWSMSGARPFFARVMCTLFNADKMTGGMFEKGLASLSEVVKGR